MDVVELKEGWLAKQIRETQAEVQSWPAEFQVPVRTGNPAENHSTALPADVASATDDAQSTE